MYLILIGSAAAIAGAILVLAASSPPLVFEPVDDKPDAPELFDLDHLIFEKPTRYSLLEFLTIYVHAFALFVARYRQRGQAVVQKALFSIRQIMMTTLFGRGLLHG